MQCPHCTYFINEDWQHLLVYKLNTPESRFADVDGRVFEFLLMSCPNAECGRLIVKGAHSNWALSNDIPHEVSREEWMVVPRRGTRPINPSGPPEYANDYQEAAAILNDSPKMSAALSRRILAELLKDFGGYDQYKLSSRIEAFTKDTSNPKGIRDNLDYLREIGDFGAHAQKDDVTGSIIEVEQAEAEWCLEIIDGLFDYYIVGPKRDEERRASFDEKVARANRKPINPSE
jgi:hypothetical protein